MQALNSTYGVMTGHTFHYSSMATDLVPERHAYRPQSDAAGEPVFRKASIVATYMHGYWPSNPEMAAALFKGSAL
jgi:cobyrinic acid a,c-diamide synthase